MMFGIRISNGLRHIFFCCHCERKIASCLRLSISNKMFYSRQWKKGADSFGITKPVDKIVTSSNNDTSKHGLPDAIAPTKEEEDDSFANESVVELLHNATTFGQDSSQVPDDVWLKGPYPHDSNYQRSQERHSLRPTTDPKETSVFLFPGQGNQYVGMGKELLKYPNVKEMYNSASEILGYDLLDLCLNGPKSELDRTVHQQPAVVVASLAAVEKLRDERPSALENCVATAGFSVGEITALTFAGAFNFEDAIKVVKVRAEAMQICSQSVPSGMMVVFYGPDSRLNFACKVAREYCERIGIVDSECRIANYLYPHCKVLAGNDEALSFIEENMKDFRLRRIRRLQVSGAFHTRLMLPAAEAFREALNKIEISNPIIPVHSNLEGKRYHSTEQIRKFLPRQIYNAVKWEQTMHVLYARKDGMNFPKTFECGPGTSLKTILKMINAKAWDSCLPVQA